jgi:hypothetical protein
MAETLIGSGKNDFPKTPTLRQYLKEHDYKVAKKSFVKTVFNPGKIPNYSFVTDAEYRVSILKGNDIFAELPLHLGSAIDNQYGLFIAPAESLDGTFAIGIDDSVVVEWEETNYGYKCSGFKPRKPATGKKPSGQ